MNGACGSSLRTSIAVWFPVNLCIACVCDNHACVMASLTNINQSPSVCQISSDVSRFVISNWKVNLFELGRSFSSLLLLLLLLLLASTAHFRSRCRCLLRSDPSSSTLARSHHPLKYTSTASSLFASLSSSLDVSLSRAHPPLLLTSLSSNNAEINQTLFQPEG